MIIYVAKEIQQREAKLAQKGHPRMKTD